MVPTKRLKANELVMMLAGLLNLDVSILARVANVPTRNLMSWLAGKKDNLRLQSIVALLSLMGIRLDDGIQLDDKRVHSGPSTTAYFAGRKGACDSLTKLSKLLTGCMITRVVPAKKRFYSGREFYMIWGDGVRLVLIVRQTGLQGAEDLAGCDQRGVLAGRRRSSHDHNELALVGASCGEGFDRA